MKLLLKVAIAAATLVTLSAPVFAQSLLDEIIQRGTINVGVGLGNPPFGMVDADLKPDGFDVQLANLIARDLGVQVNIVDTVSANRIPNLTTGKVDIVISSFSITAERAKTIAYTNTVFVDSQVYLSDESKPAASLADLVGKNVGVTRSTTNDTVMTKNAVDGTNLLRFDDDASTSQALLSGQVDGIVTSGGLARAMIAGSPKLKVQFVLAQAPMGIGLRRGDPDLLQWLNTEIFLLQIKGELGALQTKFMGAAVDTPRF